METKLLKKKMMKCGHSANAVTESGKPACAICACTEVAVKQPKLTGRTAKCCYGDHGAVPSNSDLAFFEHQPDEPFDRYYCGCYGWD